MYARTYRSYHNPFLGIISFPPGAFGPLCALKIGSGHFQGMLIMYANSWSRLRTLYSVPKWHAALLWGFRPIMAKQGVLKLV